MIIAKGSNSSPPHYAATIFEDIIKNFNVIKRCDAERNFTNDRKTIILRFDNNKLLKKLLPLNGKINRFRKWEFLDLNYYDSLQKQPLGIFTIINKQEKEVKRAKEEEQEEKEEEEEEEEKEEKEEEKEKEEG